MAGSRDRPRVWDLVHAERDALIADLEHLIDEQWDLPSLCGDWTVHDVVAHLVASAKATRLGFVVGMVRAGFDFDRENQHGVDREKGATPAETLQRFRGVRDLTSTPPAPLDTRLVEAVVHGEDIRRPLGIKRTYPTEAVERALRLQARTTVSFGGGKEHLAGLTIRATDTELSLGEGAEVAGPLLSLLLVASGRGEALGDLDGPGLDTLAGRVG